MKALKQILRPSATHWALRRAGKSHSINQNWHIEPKELSNIEIRYPQKKYIWYGARICLDLLLFEFKYRVPVRFIDLPQSYQGIVWFQLVKNGRVHDITVDYSDYPQVNTEAVAHSTVYFKMQYASEGYEFGNVIPGGYVTDSLRLYLHIRRMQQLRDQKKFEFDVYGRFGVDFATDIRERAIGILNTQNCFRFEGGLKKVRFAAFLREVARSKIVIDLPGNGAFCHRLVNYLALGACVVAYPHDSVMHVPLENHKHLVYCQKDFSDLVETCEYYLTHADEREAICSQSRSYFEANLHHANLANYYLRKCLDAV